MKAIIEYLYIRTGQVIFTCILVAALALLAAPFALPLFHAARLLI